MSMLCIGHEAVMRGGVAGSSRSGSLRAMGH